MEMAQKLFDVNLFKNPLLFLFGKTITISYIVRYKMLINFCNFTSSQTI